MADQVSQGIWGAAIAFIIIMLVQIILVKTARGRAKNEDGSYKREVRFMDLIVTCEDESYSLSRLQMYLWTIIIIMGFSAVFMANSTAIPDIHQNLYLLMGVSLASSVAATAINTIQNKPKDKLKKPDFIKDIFFESDDSLDLPRTQMFIWTIISMLAFVVMVVSSFNTKPVLPDIPTGLVALMGLSQGAYLGGKAATKN
jgi:Ca2+/Na+ antiporter